MPPADTQGAERKGMFDREISASEVVVGPFPFAHEGEITLAVRNGDYSLGPVMLELVMKPGSVIPAHIHEGISEVLYVIEGDFINEGKTHYAGTSLHVKVGKVHGPHSTEGGCDVLVLWTNPEVPANAKADDFVLATK
jgi:anti-sigma factor ChrR (cupin superfamily)